LDVRGNLRQKRVASRLRKELARAKSSSQDIPGTTPKMSGVYNKPVYRFLPRFLDQRGNLNEIAAKIFNLDGRGLRGLPAFQPSRVKPSFLYLRPHIRCARGKTRWQGAPRVRPVRPDEYQSTSTRMWMEQMAFFSVIITSHNQADFIRNAVASAAAQSHSNREIIVVDDASSDGSQQILEEYGDGNPLTKLGKNGSEPRS